MRKRILALTLALSLLLTACGGGASATTMRLRKAEGTVGVSDGEGKDVEPRDDLGLYSGYGVDTQTESYAWIDLDSVKLTKLDQDSEIAITKEGKKLEVEVKSGSLFFNVTEPLADDETMNIRTSTMMVGIRGTCGWVTQDTAALLEGTVEVTAGEQSVTISAGEMAVLTADGTLEVQSFYQENIPAFIQDENLEETILEEVPPLYPLTVLTRQTVYDNESEDTYADTYIIDYFYDEEGYTLRRETKSYTGELVHTSTVTYSHDGEGHVSAAASLEGEWDVYEAPDVQDMPYVPGTVDPIGACRHVWTNPMVKAGYDDVRPEIGPDGRLDLSEIDPYLAGYYAIYTMDANGYPVNIDTYGPDGTLTGSCTLEWAVIDP